MSRERHSYFVESNSVEMPPDGKPEIVSVIPCENLLRKVCGSVKYVDMLACCPGKPYTLLLFPGNNHQLVERVFNQYRPWWRVLVCDPRMEFSCTTYHLKWKQTTSPSTFRSLVAPQQMVNAFPGAHEITTKANLVKNMQTYCVKNGLDVWNFLPITLSLRGGLSGSDFRVVESLVLKISSAYDNDSMMIRVPSLSKSGVENLVKLRNVFLSSSAPLWLLKPLCLNRGRGIKVFSSVNELKKLLQTEQAQQEWIVQKYIEKPLLVSNRKFDIRMWAVVTQTMLLYLFKEGYGRTTSFEFDTISDNQFVHLCNNAIQKNGEEYGKYEPGNQLSFSEIERLTGLRIQEEFLPQAKTLVRMSMGSVAYQLDTNKPANGGTYFQLFGFDFLIDQTKHVWLIEVNNNPCIEESSPLLQTLLPQLINGAMELCVDPAFKLQRKASGNSQQRTAPKDIDKFELLASLTDAGGNPFKLRKLSQLGEIDRRNKLGLSCTRKPSSLLRIRRTRSGLD